jgi:O-antigen/teichoic acid export membrane protein
MGKYSRLGKNTLLIFIGSAGSKLISLILLPFYTRWFSVEDYGTTDLINVYVSLLLGIATACIAETIFIFLKDQSIEKQKEYFSSGLLLAFLTLTLTAFLFKGIALFFEHKGISNSFTHNTWFIYSLLVMSFLQQYTQQFTRSIGKLKVYSTTGIITTLSTAVFSFLIIPRRGVFGYVLALIFANFIGTVYSFLFSLAYRFVSTKAIKIKNCIEMLKYSVPLIPNSMMWWLIGALNRPLLERYLGMHSIGIFAVANKFPSVITLVFSVFSVSWQISVVEEFGKEGYDRFFNIIFHLTITGLFLVFFIIIFSSKLIINIFTTPDFYEAFKYVGILTLGAVLSSVSTLVGSNFLATRESKYFFYSSIWGAMFSVAGNILLIPRLGILGASIAVLVSYMAMVVSRILYNWKNVRIQNISLYLLMMLIVIVSTVVMLYVQTMWLKYFLFTFLFILFVYMNYGLKKYVLNVFLNIYQKIKILVKTNS